MLNIYITIFILVFALLFIISPVRFKFNEKVSKFQIDFKKLDLISLFCIPLVFSLSLIGPYTDFLAKVFFIIVVLYLYRKLIKVGL